MELYNGAFHAVSAPIISDVKCPIDRDLRPVSRERDHFSEPTKLN